ncbi:MAG: hypothetical protein NTW28_10290 [Candidatus Solibacter sp.]|nr:hypothetical protein [Candidatus Solibacter sp.]
MISRKVTRAFEAWDPRLGMVVIMNSGATLRMIRIVPEQDRTQPVEYSLFGAGAVILGSPQIKRAEEFESDGTRYCAEFDRLRENTSLEDL